MMKEDPLFMLAALLEFHSYDVLSIPTGNNTICSNGKQVPSVLFSAGEQQAAKQGVEIHFS